MKSSDISPSHLQKGGEAKVITGRAHAYTLFYQLTRPRRR